MNIQIVSILLLLCGYALGICLGIPKTFQSYGKWQKTMEEKYFGHFINDLGLTLFMLLAPSIVFIKKIYLLLG